MNRSELLKYIGNKDIILFGAGNYAQQFYSDFQGQLNICFCISNNRKQKKLLLKEKEICEVKNAAALVLAKDQIVITCSAKSQSMQEQLSDMGYLCGRDYIDSDYYRVLVSDKKIALFYGICYMRAIKDCLNYSVCFTEEYTSWHFLDYIKNSYTEQSFLYLLLETCDLFVYTSYLSIEGMRRMNAYFMRLNCECVKVSVPIVMFSGFHPRTKGTPMDQNPYCVVSSKAPYASFSNGDDNINRMIKEGKTASEIIKTISDLNFYTKEFIIDNFNQECRRIRAVERLSDINISDFINNNYKSRRLFLNESHISNVMLFEITKRILRLLRLSDELDVESIEAETFLFTSEVPIYPSVLHHLELIQYREIPKYKVFTYLGMMEMTFEEYVAAYVEYGLTMKRYIDEGIFPQ